MSELERVRLEEMRLTGSPAVRSWTAPHPLDWFMLGLTTVSESNRELTVRITSRRP